MARDTLPGAILTVIIRNDAPLIHCGDSPTYRSIRIILTDEQRQKMVFDKQQYEAISQCFIEPDEDCKNATR